MIDKLETEKNISICSLNFESFEGRCLPDFGAELHRTVEAVGRNVVLLSMAGCSCAADLDLRKADPYFACQDGSDWDNFPSLKVAFQG